MQATRYYQPYFLEDRTGRLSGSEFVDIHERVRLAYRCTRRDARGTQYCIFELSSPRDDAYTRPVIALEFGPNNELGTITFGGAYTGLDMYLPKVTPGGTTRHRTFTGQNGQRYKWSYRTHEDHEWTCVDNADNVVAFYNLKIPGEPPYPNSSGCMLTVEELYGDMSCEFLATCLLMRHIVTYGIQ
ncbi:hypothetical protein H1R20_g12323, partial [Candolleomyces eurysporus]